MPLRNLRYAQLDVSNQHWKKRDSLEIWTTSFWNLPVLHYSHKFYFQTNALNRNVICVMTSLNQKTAELPDTVILTRSYLNQYDKENNFFNSEKNLNLTKRTTAQNVHLYFQYEHKPWNPINLASNSYEININWKLRFKT